MKNEVRFFFSALMYFTRIPTPKWVNHSEEYLTHAAKYFPAMGWIVGGFAALVYYLSSFIFSSEIGLVLSLTASVLLTGAFHEDGFADVCDGFGGGWTKQRILEIMKDSRIGAYGMIGLLLLLALKLLTLHTISVNLLPLTMIVAHALSRFAAVTTLYSHDYVRENEDAKAKPLAKKINITGLMLAGVFGIAPLFLFRDMIFFLILIPVFITKWWMCRYFAKWIGGYTGDCLGAVQQVTEIITYLSTIILIRFIPL